MHQHSEGNIEDKPRIIKGGIAVDDRGIVMYCNDFAFENVKRYYTIQNHRVGFIRAWHGHKREAKYVTVVAGTALTCCIPLAEFEKPTGTQPYRFVLSALTPSVLYIPGGYANGSMALTEDAVIVHFSTFNLDETKDDDVRYPASYFTDCWKIEHR